MIKEGNDHFEVSRQEPKVDFCEKKYVFDAIRAPNATRDPVFNASAKCPAYAIPDDLADAVRQKQEADNAEYAKLVSKGVPVAKLNTGVDGGMNQVFASHVPGASTGLSEGGDGQGLSLLAVSRAPGTIPGTVNPPRTPWQQQQGADEPVAAIATAPAAQPATTRVASAAPAQQSEGFFSSLARKVGIGGGTADTTAAPRTPRAGQAEDSGGQTAAEGVQAGRNQAGRNQAGRDQAGRPSGVEALGLGYAGYRRHARERQHRRRRTADRAAQLVRQPLLGDEVRARRRSRVSRFDFQAGRRFHSFLWKTKFAPSRSTRNHFAPFNRQDVAQVVVTPFSHLMQAAMHCSKFFSS